MHSILRRAMDASIGALLLSCAAVWLGSGAPTAQEKAAAAKEGAGKANPADAYRFNTLGVAHMSQQRPADAQKYFEQALQADPQFAVARLNLGIALLGQQKLEAARAALAEATEQLPNDPYGWYNPGAAFKGVGGSGKRIAAFPGGTEIRAKETG